MAQKYTSMQIYNLKHFLSSCNFSKQEINLELCSKFLKGTFSFCNVGRNVYADKKTGIRVIHPIDDVRQIFYLNHIGPVSLGNVNNTITHLENSWVQL